MAPALTLDRTEIEDTAVDDAEFEFDMRVVKSTRGS